MRNTGLDEAEDQAWAIADDFIRGLGRLARVLVTTREVTRKQGASLVATVATVPVVDLGDRLWKRQTEDNVRDYVTRRPERTDAPPAVMDRGLVAEQIVRLAGRYEEGLFLLARVITAQLSVEPVDTRTAGWEASLATSVATAFDRDLARVLDRSPSGAEGWVAVRELLVALAWGYGAGLPDDTWAAIATALSKTKVLYSVADVYWALAAAGRYVVAADGGGRAAYRLSHQRLAQHLRPARPVVERLERDPDAVAVADAISGVFQDVAAAGDDPAGHPYLLVHAWRHCVDAGAPGIAHLRAICLRNLAFAPDLAAALGTLGRRYREVGRSVEAVVAIEEAVTLHRELAAQNLAFVADLTMALEDLGICYRDVGRRVEAVAPTEEAVALRWDLAAQDPTFVRGLASALNNLGNRYSEVGRRVEAVAPAEEAVALYRELAGENPAFVPDLATVLNNLGSHYHEVGRRVEAVAPAEESVALYRELTDKNAAFVDGLASALDSLGVRYSEVGRRVDAVAPAEEAVALYRDLAGENPAFVSNLAGALTNLSNHYRLVRRRVEAVVPAEEAVARRTGCRRQWRAPKRQWPSTAD